MLVYGSISSDGHCTQLRDISSQKSLILPASTSFPFEKKKKKEKKMIGRSEYRNMRNKLTMVDAECKVGVEIRGRV